MTTFKIAASSLAMSIALAVAPATAQTAITGFSGGSSFTGFSTDETVGFQFSTASAISVQSLGWYATTGTLLASHQIGIWDLSGNLLGQATVTPGAADGTGFRYTAVTPFTLGVGSYLIGGRDAAADGDNYLTGVSGLTTGTGIAFQGAAVSASGSGFAAPTVISANSGGRFGPNFTYAVAGVPEPATWAMMMIGFGAIGGSIRYRRRLAKVSFA